MISLDDFHQDFMQDIVSQAQSRGISKQEAFFESVCDSLVDEGELSQDYMIAEYNKRDMEASGYDFDAERGKLSLLALCFFQSDEKQTLTKVQIESKFKKLEHMYIDKNINYDDIKGISNIARAGLNEVRPLSIGEATRISGVTSNDITLIIAHMNEK